ncbi:hypothetical protein FRC07_012696 [Ceratobasidium sp. 392]|nr:hypothetical protein FRC07_012696 [Ceratobasidium sp. 392]
MDSLNIPRFYQILGYRGHFEKDYWRWLSGADEPSDFHEWAHESPAAQAIAGPDSALYVDTPVDAAGSATAQSVELILGIKPSGAICLLLDKTTFETYVIPQARISRPTNKLPPLYATSHFLSLSPIKFTSANELEEIFRAIRSKKAGINGEDDSKLNKGFTQKHPKPGRGEFEQARLLQYGYWGGRHPVFTTYGLPPLSPDLRIAYLAFTPWIDPTSYNVNLNEEVPVLDVGWYEPNQGTVHHIVIEEYKEMSKTTLPKAAFEYGESTILAEASLAGTLASLLAPAPEGPAGPLVLVTYDWPRTARLLNSHGVDTTGGNWHVGLRELLGFGRPNVAKEPQNQDGNCGGNDDPGTGDGRRPTDNGYQDRRASTNRRSGYQNLDDPNFDAEPKAEPKEETKVYGGRWDPSSPIRERSQSPRSRQRPLSDMTERKHQRPMFLPDDNEGQDTEEGECFSPHRSASPDPLTALPQIHIVDIRSLLSIALNAPTPREYTAYPPCARRLGLPVDGWCAGNQAVVLDSLVGGEPIHRREVQLRAQPSLPPPTPPPGSEAPILLEGIAAGPQPDNIQAGF